MKLAFIEAPEFAQVREDVFGGDESFRLLQYTLMETPRAGDVIQGTSGARKVRWADTARGMGRRGGIRVIYFYHEETSRILLLFAYDKNTSDLTPQQRRRIAAAIQAFRREAKQSP